METQLKLLKSVLKRSGYSDTEARRYIFGLLVNTEPQSMRQLSLRAKSQVDRASVYRIVHIFEAAGVVQRVYIGWKYKVELTDIFSAHHHHLTCLGCQKLIALPEEQAIEGLIDSLAAKHHFLINNHQLEVQGYCSDCQKKKDDLSYSPAVGDRVVRQAQLK